MYLKLFVEAAQRLNELDIFHGDIKVENSALKKNENGDWIIVFFDFGFSIIIS